jgi:hypothetical protein
VAGYEGGVGAGGRCERLSVTDLQKNRKKKPRETEELGFECGTCSGLDQVWASDDILR